MPGPWSVRLFEIFADDISDLLIVEAFQNTVDSGLQSNCVDYLDGEDNSEVFSARVSQVMSMTVWSGVIAQA